jgi:hypothetical protein
MARPSMPFTTFHRMINPSSFQDMAVSPSHTGKLILDPPVIGAKTALNANLVPPRL